MIKSKYDAMNFNDHLKIIIAEVMISRRAITDAELNAFQTVMNTVSNLGYANDIDGKEEK